jgi:hypothetical protein
LQLITKRQSDNTKERKGVARTEVVIIIILLCTICAITLSLQIAYAQNAPTSPARTVTSPGNQVTITSGANKTPATTVTGQENQITITTAVKKTALATSAAANSLTAELKIGNNVFPLNYQMTGGGNKLTGISLEKDNPTLLANISSLSKGTVTIQLPRNIIDSKQGNADDSFAVFLDGQYAAFDQIKNSTHVRTLAIDFDKGSTQIEIEGTHAVPEYSAVVPATLFTTAIIGIILATRKLGSKHGVMQR